MLLYIITLLLHSCTADGQYSTDIPRVSWSELLRSPALSRSFINSPAIITETPLHDWLLGEYSNTKGDHENRKPWLWLEDELSSGSISPVRQQIERTLSSLDHVIHEWSWVDNQEHGDFTFFNDRRKDELSKPTKWTKKTANTEIFDRMKCHLDCNTSCKQDCGFPFQFTTYMLGHKPWPGLNGDNQMHMPPANVIDELKSWIKSIDPVLVDSPHPIRTQESLFWLGSKGSRSRMHYDINHNLVLQLAGEKEWFFSTLANFSYAGYPTQHGHARQHYNKNESLEARDQFPPAHDKPQQYRVVTKAGDVLWCPDHWLHEVKALSTSVSLNMWYESWGTVFEAKMRQGVRRMQFRAGNRKCDRVAGQACGAAQMSVVAQGSALLVGSMQAMLQLQTHEPQSVLNSVFHIFCRLLMQRYQGDLPDSQVDNQGLQESFTHNGTSFNANHLRNRAQISMRKECDEMINQYKHPIEGGQNMVDHDFRYHNTDPNAKLAIAEMVKSMQMVVDIEKDLEGTWVGSSFKVRDTHANLTSPHDGINELWVETADSLMAQIVHNVNLFSLDGQAPDHKFVPFNHLAGRTFVARCLLPYTALYGQHVLDKSIVDSHGMCEAVDFL